MPIWLGSIISFVYGTVVGSFLNVCIFRIPAEQSIVQPPSHCPKCDKKLKSLDLVPLFSFLFLGRKCRYCGTPISWRYFTVELITGLLFLATYLRYGFAIDFYVYVLFISAMLVAFFVDVDQMIIPDQVVIFGLILGLGKDVAHIIAGDAKLLSIPTASGSSLPMLPSIAGMVMCAGIFYLIAYIGYFLFKPKDLVDEEEYGGALGGGDINLAAAIGAVLGAQLAVISFFLAVVLGAVIGVVILILKARSEKKGIPWRTEIPFGPYMVTGAIVVMLLYPQLTRLWDVWSRLIILG
ncbi:MAG: prepilin peptidase [Armatimonadetes bacterium]|nr:prepilin peptidase [Armatimonadota bacterium]